MSSQGLNLKNKTRIRPIVGPIGPNWRRAGLPKNVCFVVLFFLFVFFIHIFKSQLATLSRVATWRQEPHGDPWLFYLRRKTT